MKILLSLSMLMLSFAPGLYANTGLPGADEFIKEMAKEHQFDQNALNEVLKDVEVKDSILKAISRPAEKSKPWYDYRKIFITDKRITEGADYWKQHEAALTRAEQEYGVPAEIILAILGVETFYGRITGGYRVVDALSTLAFRYPPRSKFFRSELKHFFILAREEQISPLKPVGSYAGAMGLGQFMPSSYREYAVDFDGDGRRDIWTNPTDAIGSIANYLKRHGWVAGESIVHKTQVTGNVPTALLEKGSKPSILVSTLANESVSTAHLPQTAKKVGLITLTQPEGEEYWLTRQNFYSITRYNHSRMYAMAVTQLAELIKEQYTKQ